MIPDNDEEWLFQVATGVADGTHVLHSPSPHPSPVAQGDPIQAPFVNQVLVDQDNQIDLESPGGAGNGAPHIHLDGSETEVAVPEVGDRQKGVATSEVPPPRKGKRKHDEDVEGQKASRKHKSRSSSHRSGSSSKYRSFALDEEFAKKSYEDYVADPLGAAIHTVLHLGDLAKEERAKSEMQMRDIQNDRDAEKSAKEEALAELERTKNMLRRATLTLATLRSQLTVVEKLRNDLSRKNAEEKEKIASLETRVQELEATEESLRSEVERLTSKVARLEKTAVAGSSGDPDRVAET